MEPYTLGLYEKSMPLDVSWRERLAAAKDAGYDFVEICIDATEDRISRIYMDKSERLRLIEDMYEVGIPIRSMSVSALTKYSLGNPDDALCARGVEIAEGSIALAADLGVRIVMIPGYDVYYEEPSGETRERFCENLIRIEETAAREGVQLAFETMENEFMNTVKKAMTYVDMVGTNYVKVYPDIGNLTNAAKLHGHDVLEDLALGKGNLVAMHLKESLPGRFREVPFGTGHVQFEEAIRAAWDLKVRRFVTEFWYLGSDQWKEDLCDTCALFRTMFDRMLSEQGASLAEGEKE